jgi:hypothetical protein
MFGLIFSLSGCVSNDTKIESKQKEDVSANKENSSYGNTGRNYADPTPDPQEINGTILSGTIDIKKYAKSGSINLTVSKDGKYINYMKISFNNLSFEYTSGNKRYSIFSGSLMTTVPKPIQIFNKSFTVPLSDEGEITGRFTSQNKASGTIHYIYSNSGSGFGSSDYTTYDLGTWKWDVRDLTTSSETSMTPRTLISDRKILTNGDKWALSTEYYLEIEYSNFKPINVWLRLYKDQNMVYSNRYVISSSGKIQRVSENPTSVEGLVDDNTFNYEDIFNTTIDSIAANQIVLMDTYFAQNTNNQIDTSAKVVETPQAKLRSLSTGTIIRTLRSDGNGELTIKNGLNYDAVAVMTRSNDLNEALLSVYIRAGNSYTISNITNWLFSHFISGDWWECTNRFCKRG